MSTLAEKFPTKGDTVTLQSVERRVTRYGKNVNKEIDPIVTEVDVLVTTTFPEESLVMGVELHRFCYIQGFREKGRKLPAENPYGEPKRNGYVIGVWQCL
jgi:hypothetical protein